MGFGFSRKKLRPNPPPVEDINRKFQGVDSLNNLIISLNSRGVCWLNIRNKRGFPAKNAKKWKIPGEIDEIDWKSRMVNFKKN